MEKTTKDQLEIITSGLASIVAKENIQFVEKSKYDELQAKIDKAIEYINNNKHYYDDGEYSGYECEIDGLVLLPILQDEDVK